MSRGEGVSVGRGWDVDADGATAGDPDRGVGPKFRVRIVGSMRVYWPLFAVMGIALVIRLMGIYSWYPECTPIEARERTTLDHCYAVTGDAYYYSSMAENVSQGKGFVLTTYIGKLETRADHPPGYITFLAMLDKGGLDTVGEHRFVLALVGAAGVGLIALLGWRLGGSRVGPLGSSQDCWLRSIRASG